MMNAEHTGSDSGNFAGKSIHALIQEWSTWERRITKARADMGDVMDKQKKRRQAIEDWMKAHNKTYVTYASVGAVFKLAPSKKPPAPDKDERMLRLGRMVCHDPALHGNIALMKEYGVKATEEVFRKLDTNEPPPMVLHASVDDPSILLNREDLAD